MIKIWIACHKPTYVPKNPLLVPIQVGAAITARRFPGMLQDDSGENISRKNPQYCELTAQYWAWKNADAEYYGFFHYRRYLAFDQVYPVGKDGEISGKHGKQLHLRPYRELSRIRRDLSVYGLAEPRMEEVIAQYDLLSILREPLNVTVRRQFEQFHDPKALELLLAILRERYPAYMPAAEQYLSGKQIYYMNMFIMKRELFQTYAAWLFDLLGALEERLKAADSPETSQPQNRLMGYLGERLFGIFYTYQRQQGMHCAELPYLMFYDTKPAEDGGEPLEDAETGKEGPVRSFRLKPTPICIRVDMRRLNRLFPAGSRRRLWLRNLFLR